MGTARMRMRGRTFFERMGSARLEWRCSKRNIVRTPDRTVPSDAILLFFISSRYLFYSMSNQDRSTAVFPFSSLGLRVEPALVEASRQLEDKFTLVSAKKFLAKHLPDAPPMPIVDHAKFKVVAEKTSEVEMYEPLVCVFPWTAWILLHDLCRYTL